jgi:ribosomal protein L20A (L18A)
VNADERRETPFTDRPRLPQKAGQQQQETNMFEAHLSDPIHGKATACAETKEAAIELAYREIAGRWMDLATLATWPADQPMFYGEVRNENEVWCNDRMWYMIGTVREV